MSDIQSSTIVATKKSYQSKAGYTFYEDDSHWQLNKNITVQVGAVRELLKSDVWKGYEKTLIHYATNLSAAHTRNLCSSFLRILRNTGASEISESTLINYRSTLTPETEWHLGVIKGFMKKWHLLGYAGISDEIIELLNGWSLKGNIKGDVVKRLDPLQGPLSDLELQGFNEGIVQAYEKGKISISDLAIGLITSNTGRRQIQISHLKVKDVLWNKNQKGEVYYIVNVPRAKQRNATFRSSFKQFAITNELWTVLNAQASLVTNRFKQYLSFELQGTDFLELPLFPDWDAIPKMESPRELRALLDSDRLHIPAARVTEDIKRISVDAGINSERTGDFLHVTSKRFRYTTGTRAAREGLGVMVIAELLDHADTQNAHVYIENIPEHVAKLDQAVGHQLAPYAQAFAGVLVDTEADASRGGDINSRIKADGKGIGTCGSHGFCGANVPIPCYTCMHFQPWLDGPHQLVYDELIADRERMIEVTGDRTIAAINDRSILAVANVIQLCAKRRAELANG